METREPRPERRSTLALLALIVLVLAVLQIRQVRRALGSSHTDLQRGAVAPALGVDDVDGAPLPQAAYEGRARVVSFWATWCAPCRKELPDIGSAVAAWNADPASVDDVVFLAVHQGEDPGDLDAFLDDPRLRSATFAIDRDGEAAALWKVRVLPTTFFVGRDGTVQVVEEGYRRWLTGELTRAFREESEVARP